MKKIYFFVLVLLIPQIGQAQSVFQFNYKSHTNDKTTSIRALFFQHPDGSGFVRTRYEDPITKELTLIDYLLDEENFVNVDGVIDTAKIYFKTFQPEIMLGNHLTKIDTPLFLFKVDTITSYLMPVGIVAKMANGKKSIDTSANFKFRSIDSKGLTPAFFANYFQEDETFLKNYFNTNTKEIFPEEKLITIHLLVVADTTDPTVGASCAKDMKRIIATITQIKDYMGMQMKLNTICGKEYNKKNVEIQLAQLKPDKNDVVIFYYSGHGFRRTDEKTKYPNLDLRMVGQRDFIKESLNMYDIYKTILTKKARVNLVLSDCCNNVVDEKKVITSDPFKMKSIPFEFSSINIRNLFIPKRNISILACAADSTQKATCNSKYGGFFSHFFQSALVTNCTKAKLTPTWYQIFAETRIQTINKALRTYCRMPKAPENICNQIPIYTIE